MRDFSRGRWTSSGFTTRLCHRAKFRISQKLVLLKEVSVFVVIVFVVLFLVHVVVLLVLVLLFLISCCCCCMCFPCFLVFGRRIAWKLTVEHTREISIRNTVIMSFKSLGPVHTNALSMMLFRRKRSPSTLSVSQRFSRPH